MYMPLFLYSPISECGLYNYGRGIGKKIGGAGQKVGRDICVYGENSEVFMVGGCYQRGRSGASAYWACV